MVWTVLGEKAIMVLWLAQTVLSDMACCGLKTRRSWLRSLRRQLQQPMRCGVRAAAVDAKKQTVPAR